MSDEALDVFNEVVGLAIAEAIRRGGADAAEEFLTTLAEVIGGDVQEYVAELGLLALIYHFAADAGCYHLRAGAVLGGAAPRHAAGTVHDDQ